MKTISKTLTLLLLLATFLVAGAGRTLAHYERDDKGWFDANHRHHDFIQHNGHRGYWDHDDHGTLVFINI
jgi:hypothetical protein